MTIFASKMKHSCRSDLKITRNPQFPLAFPTSGHGSLKKTTVFTSISDAKAWKSKENRRLCTERWRELSVCVQRSLPVCVQRQRELRMYRERESCLSVYRDREMGLCTDRQHCLWWALRGRFPESHVFKLV